MPMSASAVVNRGELLELIDELRGALEAAFTDVPAGDRRPRTRSSTRAASRPSRWSPRPSSERENIISDTEVYRVAKREADQLLEQARAEADGAAQGGRRLRRRQAGQLRGRPRAHHRGRQARPRAPRRPLGVRRPDLRRGRQDQAARAPRQLEPRQLEPLLAAAALCSVGLMTVLRASGRAPAGRRMGSLVCRAYDQEVNPCVSTRERRSCSTPASSAAARGRNAGSASRRRLRQTSASRSSTSPRGRRSSSSSGSRRSWRACSSPVGRARSWPASASGAWRRSTSEIVADFQELFVYEESDTATHAEDEDVSRLEGDLIDLEPLLRDAVVLCCRSSRCARTTARDCAPSAVHGSPTTRATSTTSRSTRGGRPCSSSTDDQSTT